MPSSASRNRMPAPNETTNQIMSVTTSSRSVALQYAFASKSCGLDIDSSPPLVAVIYEQVRACFGLCYFAHSTPLQRYSPSGCRAIVNSNHSPENPATLSLRSGDRAVAPGALHNNLQGEIIAQDNARRQPRPDCKRQADQQDQEPHHKQPASAQPIDAQDDRRPAFPFLNRPTTPIRHVAIIPAHRD